MLDFPSKKYTITIILIAGVSLYQTLYPHVILANSSPSFSNQQIGDPINDWALYHNSSYYNPAKNISECKSQDSAIQSPDIIGVDYISDGRILNATIWLSSPFKEPIGDRYSESIHIGIDDLANYTTLSEYLNYNINYYSKNSTDFRVIESNATSDLAGQPAYMLVWSETLEDKTKLKAMKVGTNIGNKIYYIEFYAESDKFSNYLSIVQRIINSFKIEDKSVNTSLIEETPGFLTYYNATYGINIQYPSSWEITEDDTINLFAPYEDGTTQYRKYEFAINIASVYDLSTDYFILYTWEDRNQTRTKTVEQSSPDGASKLLNKQDNYPVVWEKDQGYVQMSLDLGQINYPKLYTVLSAIDDDFTRNGRACELSDTSNWVSLPPPEYTTSVSPRSLSIRQGEEKTIGLIIKSNAELDSQIFLEAEEASGLELNFSPNDLFLPYSGSTSSTLAVKASNVTAGYVYPLNIYETISLSTEVIAGDEVFINSQPVIILETIPLSIKILPPLTFEEHLKNFSNSWITPITGLWTFLAGVAAVIAPLIVNLYRKKRK
jgi:hypothetical protein